MITIRDLLVRLGVDADDKALKEFDRALTGVVNASAAVVAAVTAVTAGIVAQTFVTARLSEEVIRQAESLGLTVEGYQSLRAVFVEFDADANDVADALATITDRAEDAAAGGKSMAEDFALVGLTIDQKFLQLSPEEQFLKFAEAVATTEDESKRLAATVRVLGDDVGRKLAPLMLKGAAGIEKLRDAAKATGAVLDEDAIRASAEAAKSFRRLGRVVEGLRNLIGVSFAPLVGRLVDRISDFILTNRKLITQRVDKAVGLITLAMGRLFDAARVVDKFIKEEVGGWEIIFIQTAKAAALLGAGKGISLFGRLLFAAKALVLAIGVTTTLVFVAITAVIVGAVLAVDDFLTFLRGGRSVIGGFLEEFGRADSFLATFNALMKSSTEGADALVTVLTKLATIFTAFPVGIDDTNTALEAFDKVLDLVVLATIDLIEGRLQALTLILDTFIAALDLAEQTAAGISLVTTGGLGATTGEIIAGGANQASQAAIEALQGLLGGGGMSAATSGGGGTINNQQLTLGGATNTFNTGASAQAILDILSIQDIQSRRQAFAAFRGGDR